LQDRERVDSRGDGRDDTQRPSPFERIRTRGNMQYTLIVILLVLWLMGEATDHTFGGLLHILFLAALVVYGISLAVERRLIINEPH